MITIYSSSFFLSFFLSFSSFFLSFFLSFLLVPLQLPLLLSLLSLLAVSLSKALGRDPAEPNQPFTVKITGGTDGDVAGNAIKIMHRYVRSFKMSI